MLESLNGIKFIMAFLNLIILYFVLRKILWKPIMNFMDNRTKSIEDSIAQAKQMNTEALEMKKSYEAQLKAARTEGKEIVAEAVSKAAAQQAAIVSEANRQAEDILAKAREEIMIEREQMLSDVKNEVAGLAFAAASKVLEANMDNESNRRLIAKFIDEAGAA